jgi:hypothetical protein
MLLPALEIIGISIGTTEVVDNHLLITMIFLVLMALILARFQIVWEENQWFTWVLPCLYRR